MNTNRLLFYLPFTSISNDDLEFQYKSNYDTAEYFLSLTTFLLPLLLCDFFQWSNLLIDEMMKPTHS